MKALTGKKKLAIKAFCRLGSISEACKAAGVCRSQWYNRWMPDPAFAAAVADAREAAADSLEAVAFKRAYDGSDSLLIFLLKGLRPEKYNERRYSKIKHAVGSTSIDALAKAVNASSATNPGS